MKKTIGFIGAGNMGGAICAALVKSGLFEKENIFIYDKDGEKADALARECKAKSTDMRTAASAEIVLLAVKPNVLYSVIDEIKPFVGAETIVVSIAAGQPIAKIESAFGREIKLMRVMPNTPALVGEAMSALCPNRLLAESGEAEDIVKIFESLGKAEIVNEGLMDAVTGVSGSSPAYVFMFIEAMADAAVMAGMPRDKSYIFAAQSVLGSAKLMLETGKHPAELKDMVCSPAGTTIEAVRVLEEKGMRSAVIEAVGACVEKSRSL